MRYVDVKCEDEISIVENVPHILIRYVSIVDEHIYDDTCQNDVTNVD